MKRWVRTSKASNQEIGLAFCLSKIAVVSLETFTDIAKLILETIVICRGCKTHNLTCETGNAKLHGFDTDGFFAEYASVDYRDAIILPEKLDMNTASAFFCAGVTGIDPSDFNHRDNLTYNTAFNGVNSCDLEPGEWIVIVGCGGLGQMAIQYAKAMKLKVIGLDINDTVLQSAKASRYSSMTRSHI